MRVLRDAKEAFRQAVLVAMDEAYFNEMEVSTMLPTLQKFVADTGLGEQNEFLEEIFREWCLDRDIKMEVEYGIKGVV